MIYNFHTHTFRCRHAKGNEREYIERAIEGGIKYMGFSDHKPWRFPDGHESGFRVPTSEAQDYVDTIRALREEYKDRIKLFVGFEMEYYPIYFKDMLQYASDLDADYLICGQHIIRNEFPGDCRYMAAVTESEDDLAGYTEALIEAINSGVFTYIAHPDIIRFVGDTELYKTHMRRVCREAKRLGVPLEINCLGIRDNRHYPNPLFWEVAGEEGCGAVIGFDAHDPKSAYDEPTIPKAIAWAEKYGVNLPELPVLIDPKTKRAIEM